MDKIEIAIAYYTAKGQELLDEVIHYGEEMAIIEYKLTALEVAKEN